jgi:hypothetical protein
MKRSLPLLLVGISLSIAFLLLNPAMTLAQGDAPETWQPAENLSQSGSAADPTLQVDAAGVLHAIWLDAYAGYIHAQSDGQTWQPAQVITSPVPTDALQWYFWFGPGERLSAFWINAEDELYSSDVALAERMNLEAWTPPILWSATVRKFAVQRDAENGLHLAYLRGESSAAFPAGIYAARNVGQAGWSAPQLLYASPYFRSITAAEAHLSLTTAQTNGVIRVYVAWDNRPRQSVWLARSLDGGKNWQAALEAARPTLEIGFDMPYEIQLAAVKDQVLAVWKVGTPGQACTTYTRHSADSGKNWDSVQAPFEPQAGCPSDLQLLAGENDDFILFARLNALPYLLAWDDNTWSAPQAQTTFSSFFDPETLRALKLETIAVLAQHDTLHLIASAPDQGGDIWFTQRSLQDRPAWFATASSWSAPQAITNLAGKAGASRLEADSAGNLHAFWNDIQETPEGVRANIFYATSNGAQWSQPVALFAAPYRAAYLHSVAVNAQDTLYVAWEQKNAQGQSEGLFVSWANRQEAFSASSWVTSPPIPAAQASATGHQISLDAGNRLWVSFVLPLNEQRGVYLTRSDDGGRSWVEPVQVADAVTQGWDMVGEPQVALSAAGAACALWTTYTLPPTANSLALYAARSDDGENWAAPEIVAEGRIVWSQLLQTGDGGFHRLWLTKQQSVYALWHQVSGDDCRTWSANYNIAVTVNQPAIAAHITQGGQLHLVVIGNESGERLLLRQWQWDATQWQSADPLSLATDVRIEPLSLSSQHTSQGVLGVIYASIPATLAEAEQPASLYALQSASDAPANPTPAAQASRPANTPLPLADTNTPSPTTEVTQTQTPPSPTPAQPGTTRPQPTASLPATAPASANLWIGPIVTVTVIALGACVLAAVAWAKRRKSFIREK